MPGDPKAPDVGVATRDTLAALTQQLPAFMQVLNSQVAPQARAELASAQEISPQYNQLITDLYAKYAPQLAQTGANVEDISRVGAANTDVNILAGPGAELVRRAQALDKEQNPEFYSTRAAAAKSLNDLLSSINLGDTNPEAERLISQENARSGNLAIPSATGTVANALSFGNEAQKRRDALGQAISQATNFLQPAQSQFNPVVTALGRPSSSAGASQFGGVQKPGQTAYQQGNNLLGTAAGFQSQATDVNANRRDLLDRLNEVTSGIGSIVSV